MWLLSPPGVIIYISCYLGFALFCITCFHLACILGRWFQVWDMLVCGVVCQGVGIIYAERVSRGIQGLGVSALG